MQALDLITKKLTSLFTNSNGALLVALDGGAGSGPAGSSVVSLVDGAAVSGSATSAAVLFTADMLGYSAISVQVVQAGTTCTITYETSEDNVNWVGTNGQNSSDRSQTGLIATSSGTGVYTFPRAGRYFRARVSTYTAGTIQVVGSLNQRQSLPLLNNYQVTALNSAALFADVGLQIRAGTGGNQSTLVKVLSTATTNATLMKNSGGRVMSVRLTNTAASTRYVRFYNKATAPTVGTDSPAFTLPIPPNQTAYMDGLYGVVLATGLGYSITGAAADLDATAVAAGDVQGYITYV